MRYQKIIIYLSVFVFNLLVNFLSLNLFAATREYQVDFDFYFITKISSDEKLQAEEYPDSSLEPYIQHQLTYLYGGTFLTRPYASPGQNLKIRITKKEIIQDEIKVSYNYKGIFLVEDTPEYPSTSFQFYLPVRPTEVYEKSLSSFIARTQKPCTNRKYHQEDYFWYYFNPLGPNCPLEYGHDYLIIRPKLTELKGSEEQLLVHNKVKAIEERIQKDSTITADLLFGMDDNNSSADPESSMDSMAVEYRKVKEWLLTQGFEGYRWNTKRFANSNLKNLLRNMHSTLPFIETFKKTVGEKEVVINMLFARSYFPENLPLGLMLRNSMLDSHITIYNGHSGFGHGLAIERFEEEFGLNFYKEYLHPSFVVLNACSTYSYYKDEFSALNPQMLLMTNGVETSMRSVHRTNQEILSRLIGFIDSKPSIDFMSLSDALSSQVPFIE